MAIMNSSVSTSLDCFFDDDKSMNVYETEDVFVTTIVTCILNCLLSLVTFSGNFLIVFTIAKYRDLHSPSFILLGFLAGSDLLIGLICQPFFAAYNISEIRKNFAVFCTLKTLLSLSGWTTAGVSFLILSAVSIDRLLALTLHLRYNTIVTIPRVFQATLFFWMLSITISVVRFWMSYEWYIIPLVIIFLSFLVITISTLKIFEIVRRHQRQINRQSEAISHLRANSVNVLKCRKSAVTVLYIYGLFIIFYFPFTAVVIIDLLFVGDTKEVRIAYYYSSTVVFMNSFINPLVYCWRIRELRRAVKNIIRRGL